MKCLILSLWMVLVAAIAPVIPAPPARAAVSDWQQGATMVPMSPTDFGSAAFAQSLDNLASTGADFVTLVVPIYQSTLSSHDLGAGWDTPTDEALKLAIDQAHARGLKVMLKIHVETGGGEWRALIDAANRPAWYQAYGDWLVHYGSIAAAKGVEEYCLGAELSRMTASRFHADNASNWDAMITRVKSVYSGPLTYSAQRQGDMGEVDDIAFWGRMAHLGISGYYDLGSPATATVDQLKGDWNYINTTFIKPLYDKYQKPILFTEIGYRSYTGSHNEPWDHSKTGPYDEGEQARDYEAFLSYWNDYPYVVGVHWWDWSTNPAYGGQGNIDYTPQHKQAQSVLTNWYGGTATPPVSGELTAATVYRFWSSRFGNAHFFTQSQAETDHLRFRDRNWTYQGPAFRARVPQSGSCSTYAPVYRFYSSRFGSHFYTSNNAEKDHLIKHDPNWTYEGISYCVSPTEETGTTPLYRFWSPRFNKHFFTANLSEKNQLQTSDRNWNYEGVSYYVQP